MQSPPPSKETPKNWYSASQHFNDENRTKNSRVSLKWVVGSNKKAKEPIYNKNTFLLPLTTHFNESSLFLSDSSSFHVDWLNMKCSKKSWSCKCFFLAIFPPFFLKHFKWTPVWNDQLNLFPKVRRLIYLNVLVCTEFYKYRIKNSKIKVIL